MEDSVTLGLYFIVIIFAFNSAPAGTTYTLLEIYGKMYIVLIRYIIVCLITGCSDLVLIQLVI